MRKLLVGLVLSAAAFCAGAQSLDGLTPSTTAAGVGFDYVWNGASWDRYRSANVFKNLSAVVVTAETTIWTPTSGKKFRFIGYCLSQGVATGAVTIKDNTAGTTILVIPQNTVGQAACGLLGTNGILSATANNVLTATGVSTETLTGYIFGTEE